MPDSAPGRRLVSLRNSARLRSSSWHWDFPGCSSLPSMSSALPPPGKPGQLRDPLAWLHRPPVLFPRVPYVGGQLKARLEEALPAASPCSSHPSAPSPSQLLLREGHLEEFNRQNSSVLLSQIHGEIVPWLWKGVKSLANALWSPRARDAPSPSWFILPSATLTSCHVNHADNWQAGSSSINLPPHPIFTPGIVKL